MKKIQIIPLSKSEEARKYFNEYLTELSQFDPDIKFDEKGIPIYKWYDAYWDDRRRFPFYFLVDGNVAGLALIREISNMVYDIAEFYVCPSYRKDGNAKTFAKMIFDLFDGEFNFSTRFTNPRAIKFWTKVAGDFADAKVCDDDIWRYWTIRNHSAKTHTLNLKPAYFDLIASGEKTLEGRLNDEKRQAFKVGDYIIFSKNGKQDTTLKAIILAKHFFKDFDEMASVLNQNDLGFAGLSKEQMVAVYRNIYPSEKEQKYGVLVFKIKLI